MRDRRLLGDLFQERRDFLRFAVDLKFEALADFSIFRLVADRWGCGGMFDRWSSPEAVFGLLKELSRGRPCDITGISDYRMLDDRLYFRQLLAGRDFGPGDVPRSHPVAINNQALAQKFFPGANPVGREIRISTGPGELHPVEARCRMPRPYRRKYLRPLIRR